jgi:hypothetical protein
MGCRSPLGNDPFWIVVCLFRLLCWETPAVPRAVHQNGAVEERSDELIALSLAVPKHVAGDRVASGNWPVTAPPVPSNFEETLPAARFTAICGHFAVRLQSVLAPTAYFAEQIRAELAQPGAGS